MNARLFQSHLGNGRTMHYGTGWQMLESPSGWSMQLRVPQSTRIIDEVSAAVMRAGTSQTAAKAIAADLVAQAGVANSISTPAS